MEPLTVVEMTSEDAALFVRFQKHHALINLLESLGIFAIRNGSVTIHFNGEGGIGSVDKQQHFKI